MNIYAKHGTKVRYTGEVSKGQVQWGAHTDPRGILEQGKEYTISRTEVHSWHTKVFLIEHPNKSFNRVWFVDI